EKWMLIWRSRPSSSESIGLVSQGADHRPGRGPAAATVRRRRPALPEAPCRSRPPGADRGARGRAGPPPPPRPRVRVAAGPQRGELRSFVRRLSQLGLLIVALLWAGTLGFAVTEGTSLWSAFQEALDTVATVGSISNPHDTGGQVIKVLLIVLGVGTLFYALV